MDKIMNHQEAVDQLSDGMTVGVGGWGLDGSRCL